MVINKELATHYCTKPIKAKRIRTNETNQVNLVNKLLEGAGTEIKERCSKFSFYAV